MRNSIRRPASRCHTAGIASSLPPSFHYSSARMGRDRQGKRERRTCAPVALQPHLTTHGGDKGARDAQAQSSARQVIPAARTYIWAKHLFLLLESNTRTRVYHRHL